MDLAPFLFVAAGIQYLLGGAAITNWARGLVMLIPGVGQWLFTLLVCTACCGWWVGIVMGALGKSPFAVDALGVLQSGLVAMVGVPLIRYFGPDGGSAGGDD
jgi:hypothetical protein